MNGWVFSTSCTHQPSPVSTHYDEAYRRGKANASPIQFTVTAAGDLRSFIEDPKHNGSLVGTLMAPQLSSQPLVVTDGVISLFEQYFH